MRKQAPRQTLFYFLFTLFIIWIIVEPTIQLEYKDGCFIILLVILIHSHIDKKHLYRKVVEKYQNQTNLLNSIFMNCPDLIYRKDKNLRYIDCNPVMKKMLSIDKDSSIYKKNDFDFYDKETAKIIRNYDQKVIDNADVVSYKIEKKMFNGETKIYDTLLAPIIKENRTAGVLGILRDVTQVELLKEKILIQNAQLNSIINNIPFMIYMKDLDGRVIMCNSRMEKHLQLPRDKIIGSNPENVTMQGFKKQIQEEDRKIIETKQTIVKEVQSTLIYPTPTWYQIIKSPIFDDNNSVIGIIVTVKNIENEKRIEKQKQTLVETITHDLKTPTTAQTTAMNILLSGSMGELTEEQKEIVQLAKNSNIYMSNMISTILDAYKSEEQSIILEPELFDFNELVSSTAKDLSILAYTRNQNLCVNSTLKDNIVKGDKLQLKRAIMNLISNAITYGFENTDIVIEIKENNENIIFNVINQSLYIQPEKIKDLFEKYKTKENAKFNKASTGLGLYLSKQIITKHNGEIYAKSFENETCEFGFTIPRIYQTNNNETKTSN